MSNQITNECQPVLQAASECALEGKLELAESIFVKYLEKEPESVEILSHLGYFYYQTGRLNQSVAIFQKRNALVEPDTGLCRILGEMFLQMRDDSISLEWFQRAVLSGDSSLVLKRTIFKIKCRLFLRKQWNRLILAGKRTGLLYLYNQTGFLLTYWIICILDFFSHKQSLIRPYLRFVLRNDPETVLSGYAYHKTREAELALRLLDYLGKGQLLLDVGAGKNSLPVFMGSIGYSTIVMDGSMYGFERLKRVQSVAEGMNCRFPVDYISGDGTVLPLQNNSVDGITVLCVLEHIPGEGDRQCMQEFFRILKPGGKVLVTVEASATEFDGWLRVPYEIGYQLQGEKSPAMQYHDMYCRNYSPASMKSRLATGMNWEIVEEGWYDDWLLPIRSWLDSDRHFLLSGLLRPFQPVLSQLFYRQQNNKKLSPSSIGYLILAKPL